jgi:radical SAM superfamily enzyme YgiQ (UPF0313 family)
MRVVLLSTYELGHQPLGLARPAAQLIQDQHEVVCADLSVEKLPEEALHGAALVGISVPMHTATRLGVRLAERVRALNPHAHVCFYGLYASLNAESLLGRYADSVIGGEYETPLRDLVQGLAAAAGQPALVTTPGPVGVATAHGDTSNPFLGRQQFALPRRDLLPALDRYAHLDDGHGRHKLAGYVEASRGCAHRCLHCPITPVYSGRLRIVQADVVIEDVRQLVRLGAEHITFGDPDFFNGVKHSLRIIEALHQEYPGLTYDATIKVEHLLEHRALLSRLKDTGCVFIVSAVEAVDDTILGHLEKGHTAAHVEAALDLVTAAGLVMRPTFVAFTPWTTLEGYRELLAFIERRRLINHVEPVQLAIRLLVPRGSSLIGTTAMDAYLGEFDETTLTYTWRHPDPRMDELQVGMAGLVEEAARAGDDAVGTFSRIKSLAKTQSSRFNPQRDVVERPRNALRASRVRPSLASGVPRLTEPWFC